MNESQTIAAPPHAAEPEQAAFDEPPHRPFLITLFCVLTFVGVPIALIDDWTDPNFLGWQRVYLTVHSGIELILCFQLWRMRRWSVFAYAALVAVFQVVLWVAGIWHPLALALPAPALLILFAYAPRMH